MRTSPKISIVIPSYNKVEYIQETLESIVSQKYPNLEVIIQDGGSNDGSLEIIKKYAKKYPKIFNWVSKKDKGQVDAINKGFSKATGNLATYINADDLYEKNALFEIAQSFLENPKSTWFAGKGKVVDKKGTEIAKLATLYKTILLYINARTLLLMVNYLIQPSVFLSTEAYSKRMPFDGTRKFVVEYDMWLKLSQEEMPTVINKNLSRFRIAEGTITRNMSKGLLKEDERALEKYTNNPLIIIMHKLHNKARLIFEKKI